MVWFDFILWQVNHSRLFNANSSLYIYIKYIGFGLVWFYGISTIVYHLMPNPLYTYILNIYDLIWFDFIIWHINHCMSFNEKSSLYIYIQYIWFLNNLLITFLNEPTHPIQDGCCGVLHFCRKAVCVFYSPQLT